MALVEGEAADRRSPRALSPRPRVRIRALPDNEYGADLFCASCEKYHETELYIHAAGTCHRSDFRPSGAASFVSTHPIDDDDIATIAAHYGPVATGPSRADPFYHPARTVDPADLL